METANIQPVFGLYKQVNVNDLSEIKIIVSGKDEDVELMSLDI